MNREIRRRLAAMERLRLPDLQGKYAELVGEPTRCPNKAFLLRRIGEALEAQARETEASAALAAASSTPSSPEPLPEGTRLSALSVDELQACYVATLQRPTQSSDRRYLIWKIRQAQKGRVPVGPTARRQPGEPPIDHKILPLRMHAETVEALDEVWHRLGLKSRMEFFRHALDQYLTSVGEEAAAAHVRAR
jgi:hypothetical protein